MRSLLCGRTGSGAIALLLHPLRLDRRFRQFLAGLLTAGSILAFAPSAEAQTNWVTLSGGNPGILNSGQTATRTWLWAPGGSSITGTVDMTRTGAGQVYGFTENHQSTIIASGFGAPAYSDPYANSVGGVTGIFHFGFDGEFPRAPDDAPAGAFSTTVIDFKFNGVVSSPDNTIISLFDPGSGDAGLTGPFTYNFDAFYQGAAIDTSTWTVTVVDPYPPTGTPTNYTWNAATATYTLSSFPSATGGNFPDTLVFINTNNTTFDRLVLTANGLATDTLGVGFGSANVPNLPVTLRKTWVNGKSGDTVNLTLAGAGAENPTPGTSTPPSTTTAATANGLPGQTVTLSETFATGSAANYTIAWECRRVSNNSLVASGTGANGSFSMPTDSGVVCTFTNTRIAQQINLAKTWQNATVNHAISVTTTGGTNNPTLASTANTANETDLGAAVTVYAGDVLTLPAETFSNGNQANYLTAVACSGGSTLASGATGRQLTISNSTTATTCTYTNTKRPILRLQKSLPLGRFVAADQFALSVVGPGAPAPVTTTGSGTTATGSVIVDPATIAAAYTLSETAAAGANLGNYTVTWNCSNAFAGGQTPSGNGASFSITPVAGDDLTCTLVNTRLPLADLSITKTNTPGVNGDIDQANDTLARGATTTYTIVVTNNGPDAVTGAVLRDPAASRTGLNCPGPAPCSGAGCPAANLPLAQLDTGVTLATLAAAPPDNRVTVTLTCTVQ